MELCILESLKKARHHGSCETLLPYAAKTDKKEFLVLTTKTHFLELFEKNEFALKWNLWVRGNIEDHLQRWKKWEASQKN